MPPKNVRTYIYTLRWAVTVRNIDARIDTQTHRMHTSTCHTYIYTYTHTHTRTQLHPHQRSHMPKWTLELIETESHLVFVYFIHADLSQIFTGGTEADSLRNSCEIGNGEEGEKERNGEEEEKERNGEE